MFKSDYSELQTGFLRLFSGKDPVVPTKGARVPSLAGEQYPAWCNEDSLCRSLDLAKPNKLNFKKGECLYQRPTLAHETQK